MLFAKDRLTFKKKTSGLELLLFRKATGPFGVSLRDKIVKKRILFWSKILKIKACSGGKLQNLGLVLDF